MSRKITMMLMTTTKRTTKVRITMIVRTVMTIKMKMMTTTAMVQITMTTRILLIPLSNF